MLPKDLVALQALQLINEARQRLGAPSLLKLLPGQRCSTQRDCLANSLSAGTDCKFHSLLGWVSAEKYAVSALVQSWGTDLEYEEGNYFVREPFPLREFMVNFDLGLYPGLIEDPENPILPLYADWRLF